MAVKVLITRQFTKGKIDEAFRLLKEVRAAVTLQEGYISGQTLVNVEDPNKIVVVSTWAGRKNWAQWKADPKRHEFSKKLEPLLEGPETLDVFYAGVQSGD